MSVPRPQTRLTHLAQWPTPVLRPAARSRGNAADLCFDKVVRKCTSFVIACEAYDTEVRGGLMCLGDLTAEEMVARKTQRLPLEVRKSIAFLRIWVRAAPPPLAPHLHAQ